MSDCNLLHGPHKNLNRPNRPILFYCCAFAQLIYFLSSPVTIPDVNLLLNVIILGIRYIIYQNLYIFGTAGRCYMRDLSQVNVQSRRFYQDTHTLHKWINTVLQWQKKNLQPQSWCKKLSHFNMHIRFSLNYKNLQHFICLNYHLGKRFSTGFPPRPRFYKCWHNTAAE